MECSDTSPVLPDINDIKKKFDLVANAHNEKLYPKRKYQTHLSRTYLKK